MDPVRIALVETPRLTSDLVQTLIRSDERLTVVAEARDGAELLDRLDAAAPSVVVWGTTGEALKQQALPVLRRRADLAVVGITAAGRGVAVCTLRPHLEPLEALSGAGLVRLLLRLGGQSA